MKCKLDSNRTRRRPPERETCSVQGCKQTITHRKPYCIDHLDRLPYVKDVKNGVALRDAPGSPILDKEIVCMVELLGPSITVGRISRETMTSFDEVLERARVLEKQGLVKMGQLIDRQGRTRPIISMPGTVVA